MKKINFGKFRSVFTTIGRVLSVILALMLVVFCKMFDSVGDKDISFGDIIVNSITSVSAWVLAITMSICWLVFYIQAYGFFKRNKLELRDSQEIFTRFRVANKSKPKNFKDYLLIENMGRKKEAYLMLMDKKLADIQTKMEETPFEKRGKRKWLNLAKKEQEIQSRTTDEYLIKNLKNISVSYNRVQEADFKLDRFTDAKITDKVTSDESKIMARKSFVKVTTGVIGNFAIVGVLLSIAMNFNFKDAGFWATIVTVIFSCFVQVYFAGNDADRLVDSEILAPTIIKTEIIQKSIEWDKADNSNNVLTKALEEATKKEMNVTDKVKPTITKAQLEYLQSHEDEINKNIENERNDANSKEVK